MEFSKVAKNLASRYFDEEDLDLHQELAKIASDNSLNAQGVERIVNRANRNILVTLQKEAVQGDRDPHFTFPPIKTARVLAIVKNKNPQAKASAPPAPRPDISQVFGDNPDPGPSPDEKAIALGMVRKLRQAVSDKKSKLCRLEMALESLVRNFEKQASHELLSGTPVEVFEALPIPDIVEGVTDKIEGWGQKLAHLQEDFELDTDHKLVKTAHEIVKLKGQIKEAQHEIKEAQNQVEEARRKYYECTD